jgi:hypothetical protein
MNFVVLCCYCLFLFACLIFLVEILSLAENLCSPEVLFAMSAFLITRYFGLVDYDADMSAIRKGTHPVFEGLPVREYSSADQVKMDFANRLIADGNGKYRWALGMSFNE